GAAAVVIRSVTSAMDDNPHTGTLIYTEDLPRIPAGALGYQSADKLTERLKADPKTRLTLTINSQWFPDALSHNVVGELKGSERPDEIIAIGGHLDAWDVGEGAHDDGAGCMQAIMVLRTLQKLGIKPRHTLRAVMFMNEENGLRGGKRYADLAVENTEYHVFLLESDAGAFTPRGFGVNASDEVLEKLRSFVQYFDPNTVTHIRKGGGGADIGPLHRATGTPMAGLMVDTQRTFDYHHAETDLFENVNRRELELGTAAMAAFIYLIDKYGLAADGPQSE
nr:M20/M25/M40 family metallo-hydrolase [Calditrichia bacterium]